LNDLEFARAVTFARLRWPAAKCLIGIVDRAKRRCEFSPHE